jgi:DNA-binding Lrp family transcriptional regulator
MPKKISNEIKLQAQELRTQGKSYEEISKALDVSLSWCWHNLKAVRAIEKEIIDELEKKSRTQKGVSKGEIARAIDQDQKPEQLHKDVKKVAQRIKKRSKENIIRPNWMVPQFSVFMTEQVIQEAMAIEQRTHEYAYELHMILLENATTQEEKDQVPSVLSIKSAICGMAQAMTSQSSATGGLLINWLESLHKTSLKLEERNSKVSLVVKVQKESIPKELLDLSDCAY